MNGNLRFKRWNGLRLITMDLVKSKIENTKRFKTNYKPTIVLMTRWHATYRCKSRLSKDIGAFKAAKSKRN